MAAGSPRGKLSTVRVEMMAKDKSITTLRILRLKKKKKERQKTTVEFQLSGDTSKATVSHRPAFPGDQGTLILVPVVLSMAVCGHRLGCCPVSPLKSHAIHLGTPRAFQFLELQDHSDA